MNDELPTIVLLHGAFAESASWNPVIERLDQDGAALMAAHKRTFCDIVAIANPLRGVSGDAAYVRAVIRAIGGPVILAAHSYGGMVMAEAASGVESVVALVHVAAFAPDHDESAFQLSAMFPGSTLADALDAYPLADGGNEFAIKRRRFHEQFAADVPSEQARLMAVTQRPVTEAALTEGLRNQSPAWNHKPSWFVFGDRDLNIPAALQRFMAERAGSRGTREVAGASHAITVSQPGAVSSTILDAVVETSLKPLATT